MSILDCALAGINVNTRGMTVVANNLANVATEGYRAQRYDPATGSMQPRYAHPVSASPSCNSEPEPSDVELATEFVEMRGFEAGFRASAMMVKVADRMQGTLLDIFG